MDIFVLPKYLAVKYEMQEPHAWISINDPDDTTSLPINPFTEDVLTLHFDDMETADQWDIQQYNVIFKRNCVLFNKEMAEQIYNFFQKNKSVENLMIHCHAGISRSAGVGSFLSQVIGKNDFMNPPHFPNILVRHFLRKVWLEKEGILIP